VTRRQVIDHRRRRAGQDHAAGGSSAQQRLAQAPDEAGGLPDSDADPGSAEAGGVHLRALDLVQAEFAERTWQAFRGWQSPAGRRRTWPLRCG
jgi:hypothetical protein